MTLDPKLESGAPFERAVNPGPSPLASIANVAAGFLSPPKQVTPSAKQIEASRLDPLARKLNDLHSTNASDAVKTRQSRKYFTDWLVVEGNSAYRAEADALMASFGIEQESPTLLANPEDVHKQALNDYIATPEGQRDYIASRVFTSTGEVDNALTSQNFQVKFEANQLEKALIETSARELQLAQDDRELYEVKSKNALDRLSPVFRQAANSGVDGLISNWNAGIKQGLAPPAPEEILSHVRDELRITREAVASKAAAAGLTQADTDILVADAIKPYENFLAMVNNNMADTGSLLTAFNNTKMLELSKGLVDKYGAAGAHPAAQEAMMTALQGSIFGDAGDLVTTMQENAEDYNTGSLSHTMVPGLVTPKKSSEAVRASSVEKYMEMPSKKYTSHLKNNVSILNRTSDPHQVAGVMSVLLDMGEAGKGALPLSELQKILNSSGLKTALMDQGEAGTIARQYTDLLIAQQSKRANDIVDVLVSQGNGEVVVSTGPNGMLMYTAERTEPGTNMTEFRNIPKLTEALNNLNFLNSLKSENVDTQGNLELLAKTIQAEAGNQGFNGMLAVGAVIANRAGGENWRGAILAPGQFSAWNSKTGYAGGEQGQDMDNIVPSAEANRVASLILSGNYTDPTNGATHYYNPSISDPAWGQNKAGGEWATIGAHIFGKAGAYPTEEGETFVTSGRSNTPSQPATPAVAPNTPEKAPVAQTAVTPESIKAEVAAQPTASPESLGGEFVSYAEPFAKRLTEASNGTLTEAQALMFLHAKPFQLWDDLIKDVEESD